MLKNIHVCLMTPGGCNIVLSGKKGEKIGLVMLHPINVELRDRKHGVADNGACWPQLVAF